jgi:hypothetical protein
VVGFLLALLLPCSAAYLLACRCVQGSARDGATFGVRAALAVGLGLGLSAATYFLWLLICGSPGVGYRTVELIGWAASIVVLLKVSLRLDPTSYTPRSEDAPSRKLAWAFSVVILIAAATTICESLVEPYGDWNAWSVWNVRARFLFLGGEDWRQAFSPALRHPDYPLLVPATVARIWTYLHVDAPWASWLIGNLFTWASVVLAACGVAKLKGPTQGLFAGLVLAGNVAFMHSGGVQQYADVPLAYFMLAAVVLLTLHDIEAMRRRELLCLAGLCAGLAAWTKNEGLLFLVALVVARGLAHIWQRPPRRAGREFVVLLSGIVPMLVILALQKTLLASHNKLVNDQGFATTLGRIVDGSRHLEIVQAFFVTAWKVARGFLVVLPIVGLLLGWTRRGLTRTTGFRTACLVLGLMLAGYYCIYLITPYDLTWHLRTSLNRLFIQLWPSGVFVFFVAVASPGEVARSDESREETRTETSRNEKSQEQMQSLQV